VQIRVGGRALGAAVALALIGLAVLVLWRTGGMPPSTVSLPGPGFFPTVLAVLLVTAAAVLLVLALRGGTDEAEPVSLGGHDTWLTAGALFMVAFLFERAGATLALGLFVTLLGWRVARTSLPKAVAAGVIAGVAVWLAFDRVLGVPLPPIPFLAPG